MAGSLDPITQIRAGLAALRCSGETFAMLLGMSGSTMSAYLVERRRLSNPDALRFLSVLKELNNLVILADPFHVDFGRVQSIQILLRRLRAGELVAKRQSNVGEEKL